jgi:hypothetical protein
MNLVQISFLSYVLIDDGHPYAGVLSQYKYVFGYNDMNKLSKSIMAKEAVQVS